MKRLLILFAAVSLLSGIAFGEGEWEAERNESLKGLQGVGVMVSIKPKEEAERNGLRLDQVQTEVELRLRTSGIRVPNEKQRQQTPRRPRLQVEVFLVKHSFPGRYSYVVDVAFYQDVSIDGDPKRRCHACTWWGKQFLGTGTSRDMTEDIRRVIQEQESAFINAYLAANPK